MNRVYPISTHYGDGRIISRVFRWQCTTGRQWLDKTSESLLFTAERLLYARRLIDIILKNHGNSKMCEKTLKDQGEYTEEDLGFWSRREVVDGEIADEIENIKWIENWFHVRVLDQNECEYHAQSGLQILIIATDLNC